MANKNPLQHQARKRFGQNFLVDHGVIRHIVRAIGPQTQDNIVEIGPGQGAITASLLEACPELNVVELDRDLIPILRVKFDRYPGFKINEADALKFDFSALADGKAPLRVVGNLPYNISTPLIFHLLEQRQSIKDMHFMLQKEVVLRLAAKPGDKNFGRLSVMAQYWCDIEDLFDVPPECFRPAPKVMSAIVRLVPHNELPHVAHSHEDLETVVKLAFSQRRKTLRNALKSLLDTLPEAQLCVDLGKRAEALDVADFVALSNQITALKQSL
ncbi:16S rRNA (adenine(1518)-N(6)/adenine(1519)-N(6))-dimethyltransferase RsmA [Agaribacterium haliotis]|uniref:16S rRNA (adenine(1518)-N(6)/adenine(1519)-N(6))- dimethyltransferase RsmA n=1 Tax=Agaribacterium haliotis TaxID=2013869 RepID=UPI000BB55465|nr:16S rRNA (adenine(1518)-N(6)/adenine(1519)-N(6))-dimethyltransferase RsmA [Agaribacterium haliotis]